MSIQAQIRPYSAPQDQTVNKIVSSLIEAENDSLKMAAFFIKWNRRLKPNSRKELNKSEGTKAVYNVFKVMFQPYNLELLGNGPNPANIPNGNSLYVVVQNKIFYTILKDDVFANTDDVRGADSIIDFRPPVHVDRTKVLYLTIGYKQGIDSFLGIVPRRQLKEMLQTRSAEAFNVFWSRAAMLERFMPIDYNIARVVVASAPQVLKMEFNNRLTKAVILYSLGGGGSRGFLEKHKGHWKLIRTEVAWYE